MKLAMSSKYFSGIPVRDFLKQIQYKTSDQNLIISLSLVCGTNHVTLKARQRSYLTHSTEMDHQIRFPLKDRVVRSIEKLADDVQKKHRVIKSLKVNLLPDDFISIHFFKNIKSAEIQYLEEESHELNLLTSEEVLIQECLVQSFYQMEILLDKSQERIYAGDYRTAYKILSQIPDRLKNDRIHHMLGLCTNFFGLIEESEKHFFKMLNSSNPSSFVKASYVMAMLFLRMYEKEKQDLHKAEVLLQNAYEVLKNNPEIPDHNFHSVFNRNGYALCLFRRGHVTEALEMLQAGIGKLETDSSGAKDLHKSVLIYNAVQCLRSLKRYSECEKMAETLLEIDPLFPEYHLEIARALLEQEKIFEAITNLKKAMELDAFIPETYALLGYAELQLAMFENAARFYARAYQMRPQETQWALDQAYCLSEAHLWGDLEAVLEKIKTKTLSIEQMGAFSALQSELMEGAT